jgi:t-SNARE complex subunit (syntaxin)
MGITADGLLIDHFPRFAELVKAREALRPTLLTSGEEAGKKAQPPEGASASTGGGFMREFFSDVAKIQAHIDNGRRIVKGMGGVIEVALLATTRDKEAAASACLEKEAGEVRALLAESKGALEQLKARCDKEEAQHPGGAQGKIRANMQLAMARKHQQLLQEFQKTQIDFKQVLEQRQQREMMLLMPEASKEEVQQLIQDGGTSAQLIMERMAGAHASILDEVQRTRDKHSDILRLEQSIAELAQMFQEMAVLVDAQGELLNSIEANVHNTKSYTHKAEKQLVTTTKLQRNTRKWHCCLMVCMFLVALAVLLPVIIKVA